MALYLLPTRSMKSSETMCKEWKGASGNCDGGYSRLIYGKFHHRREPERFHRSDFCLLKGSINPTLTGDCSEKGDNGEG
jgi:hypothetical protein